MATRTITLDQFHDEARARFGPDPDNWAYQCPTCGDTATGADITYALSQQPAAMATRNRMTTDRAIGRYCLSCPTSARDHHTTLVRLENGRTVPIFELAPATA